MTKDALLQFAKETYGSEAEYLWAKFPDTCVLRHSRNRKWYAVLMEVTYRKLGIDQDGVTDVAVVKFDKFETYAMAEQPGICLAYHMNKDSWLTLLLDGSCPESTVTALLGHSYDLTKGKSKK